MTDLKTHLNTRRSVKARCLAEPAPTPAQIEELLTMAARTPDHGKMTPYYFIVWDGEARAEISGLLREAYRSEDPEAAPAKLDLEAEKFMRSPLVIAVVSRIREGKHPQWEQLLCAGAVCMNLVHAAHALGFAANWLTEWMCFNDHFKQGLGLEDGRDNIAGFIYIGTPTEVPEDRERSDLSLITTHWSKDASLVKGDEAYNKDGFGIPRKGFALSD
ncbi:MAG: nitroreductase [Pseudobdellovibrionaceae bacterium]